MSIEHPQVGGVYRHYKGGLYRVLSTHVMFEPLQRPLVLYRSVEVDEPTTWARTLKAFCATVEKPDGTKVPRFTREVGHGEG